VNWPNPFFIQPWTHGGTGIAPLMLADQRHYAYLQKCTF